MRNNNEYRSRAGGRVAVQSKAPSSLVRPVDLVSARESTVARLPDVVAAEEPLEIRLGGSPFVVIMRTPGADRELAAGFLLSEQVIQGAQDVGAMRYCADADGAEQPNVLDVWLAGRAAERAAVRLAERRLVAAGSSCGVCGRRSIDDLMRNLPQLPWRGPCQVRAGEPERGVRTAPAPWGAVARPPRAEPREDAWKIPRSLITALPARLRAVQSGFEESGGLHAAGLFAADASLVSVAEDVGRHSAVDKVIGGQLLLGRVPLGDHLLFVSGRTSFEIVQKAAVAGVQVVAAVSAPSSLAVDLALRAHVTLLGFVRGDTFNIYAGAERIEL
ncbi:MAG: formate dehydrogenase accessory sulfurtransferase FdhD [Acidobacteria bacterium]|nr:formate dehydrogenase accessory sulfurtransferase FdhD [Acidobacteriota bacterium]